MALQVVAEFQESTFEFAVIGVAGDPHFYGELADTDEVFGGAEGKVGGILLWSELVGSQKAIQVDIAVIVTAGNVHGAVFVVSVLIGVKHFPAVHADESFQLAVQGGTVIYSGNRIQTDTGAQFIVFLFFFRENVVVAVNALYAEFSNKECFSCFLFQFGNTDAEVGKIIGILS